MRTSFYGLVGLLLLAGLASCSLGELVNSPADQGQQSLDTFVKALRVAEFSAAATCLKPENRKAFLETFDPLEKDLTIVDVRIEEIVVAADGRQADVQLEIDYFLLPSAVVKTFQFDHTWIYVAAEKSTNAYYVITTPFPPFP
jgi:hypothetical protein